jgi:retinol dehydrogenase 12
VNNAGLAGQRGLTKDGFELTFGTNHVGPYLFTRLLLPAIEKADTARIVNVASKAHRRATAIDFDVVRTSTPSISGVPEYNVSKLANVLFSRELSRRVPSKIRTYALHPGVIASDVWREVPWGARHLMKLFMLTNEQGARTTLYCATDDAVRDHTGRYYDACREVQPAPLGRDDGLAKVLWERTAEWTDLPALPNKKTPSPGGERGTNLLGVAPPGLPRWGRANPPQATCAASQSASSGVSAPQSAPSQLHPPTPTQLWPSHA